jgi:hypothetical protein
LAGEFAQKIIGQQYGDACSYLAPWLRNSLFESDLRAMMEDATRELPFPGTFTLDGNSCTLEDLEVTEHSPPTKPLSAEITPEIFGSGWSLNLSRTRRKKPVSMRVLICGWPW